MGIVFIAQDLHLGKVVISLSVPQSKLRAQIENLTSVLYQREGDHGGLVKESSYYGFGGRYS